MAPFTTSDEQSLPRAPLYGMELSRKGTNCLDRSRWFMSAIWPSRKKVEPLPLASMVIVMWRQVPLPSGQ